MVVEGPGQTRSLGIKSATELRWVASEKRLACQLIRHVRPHWQDATVATAPWVIVPAGQQGGTGAGEEAGKAVVWYLQLIMQPSPKPESTGEGMADRQTVLADGQRYKQGAACRRSRRKCAAQLDGTSAGRSTLRLPSTAGSASCTAAGGAGAAGVEQGNVQQQKLRFYRLLSLQPMGLGHLQSRSELHCATNDYRRYLFR